MMWWRSAALWHTFRWRMRGHHCAHPCCQPVLEEVYIGCSNGCCPNGQLSATASYLEKDFQEAVSRKEAEPAMESARNQWRKQYIFYSPLVLSIAREEHISATELAAIPGTGAENRVTKNDIIAFVEVTVRKKQKLSSRSGYFAERQ
jgi:pyruvate/2-oxoglutarate dehydrogenase complex dihydrolipoamide acyltransferase (E2) component